MLDDCDPQFRDKKQYDDNLTLLSTASGQVFRISGFNNCQSIGSNHAIAVDPARKCIWVVENAAQRIRRFDLKGNETLTVPIAKNHGSALAVDPLTGNVWALAGEGRIGGGKTFVYDDKGKQVAKYDISGWDIVYDGKAKAFWIAEKKLMKISAATGKEICSVDVSTWCATSVDVDQNSGAAWVAVGEHPGAPGSMHQILKVTGEGKVAVRINQGWRSPHRVSVDAKDGSVWVANYNASVQRFSADGNSQAEYPIDALAVQVDPAGGDVWVVTPGRVCKLTRKGDVLTSTGHAGPTFQAWIAALE